MTPGTQVFLSGALTFGVPLLLAVRELLVIRRPSPGAPPDENPPPPPMPPPPRYDSDRPLPACLVPQRRPERVPELA